MVSGSLREELISVLLCLPGIGNRNRRDELLANFPQDVVDTLSRDDAPRTDLQRVIAQLEKLGRHVSTDEWPIVAVAKAAKIYVEGFEAGQRLADIIQALENHYGSGKPDTGVLAALPLSQSTTPAIFSAPIDDVATFTPTPGVAPAPLASVSESQKLTIPKLAESYAEPPGGSWTNSASQRVQRINISKSVGHALAMNERDIETLFRWTEIHFGSANIDISMENATYKSSDITRACAFLQAHRKDKILSLHIRGGDVLEDHVCLTLRSPFMGRTSFDVQSNAPENVQARIEHELGKFKPKYDWIVRLPLITVAAISTGALLMFVFIVSQLQLESIPIQLSRSLYYGLISIMSLAGISIALSLFRSFFWPQTKFVIGSTPRDS